jgi:hypothetical protein
VYKATQNVLSNEFNEICHKLIERIDDLIKKREVTFTFKGVIRRFTFETFQRLDVDVLLYITDEIEVVVALRHGSVMLLVRYKYNKEFEIVGAVYTSIYPSEFN